MKTIIHVDDSRTGPRGIGLPPEGSNGQILVSSGGNTVYWANSEALSVNTATIISYAGNAYSNAVAYAANAASNAYANAVAYSANVSANAYTNAVAYAANVYTNSIAYAANAASTAYANAIAYAANTITFNEIDARLYITADGVTDDRAGLALAANAAVNAGKPLRLPAG